MNRIEELDALRGADWSGVYRDVPQVVDEGVQMAFARIHAHERRRKYAVRLVSVAACLCVLVGAGALAKAGFSRRSADIVTSPARELPVLTDSSIVYASKEDPCFHIYSSCSRIQGGCVEIQLITAREFEKEICAGCGAGVQLPG